MKKNFFRNKLNIPGILLLGFFIFSLPVFSQKESEEELTLRLQHANQSLYHDPENAISLGTYVYNHTRNNDTKITALAIIVNGYASLHQTGNALRYSKKALQLADRSKSKAHKIWAMGLMGEQYQLAGQNAISREYLNEAKNLIATAGFTKESEALSLGNIYAITGNGYKDEIDCEYAIENYDLAIASYLPFHPESSAARNNLALAYLEKGNCLLELRQLQDAVDYFNKALEIAREYELREYREKGEVGLAIAASKMGDYKESSAAALHLVTEIDTVLHLELKKDLYEVLATNYLAVDSLEKFRNFESKLNRASEEIENLNNRKFQEALQFIEEEAGQDHDPLNPNRIILYVVLIFTVPIAVYEGIRRMRKQKKN